MIWISILMYLGFTQASAQDPCAHTRTILKCVKYIRNYDGDTLTVDVPKVHSFFGENAKVRVRGIDTPEIQGRRPCEKDVARTARRLTESLLKKAKQIDLENLERDKYFRILADVRVDGRLLAEVLIKNKLAVPYEGKKKPQVNWCQALSGNAKR
jgi:micrococcal nuclease